ncbi:MAG: hypothetical protein JXM71_10265, partial [Spirochaetales bacterium]|nr:hypothetical protein [Spirochaetales bacterium]
MSDTRYLFTYTVAAGNTASTALSVDSFDLNGAIIADAAGNSFAPAGGGALNRSILVDTATPAAPLVSGITAGTKYTAQSFTITGEAGAVIEYTIDSGSNWQTYVSAVSIGTNGSYVVQARQSDAAGNVSPVSSATSFDIDAGELLTSLSTTRSDGRYGAGTDIDIVLNLRKAVTVSGTPALSLNTSPVRQALYTGGSGTMALSFRYTVQEGDSASALDVTALVTTGVTFTDANATVVNAYVNLPAAGDGNTLAEQRVIDIVTGAPLLQSASLFGANLTLAFNRVVFKGAGEIVLSVTGSDYRIPAVLSESRYNELYGKLF